MNGATATHARFAAFGLLLGFALVRIGFTDFDQVHRMFVFADLRLLFTFAGGVALTMVGLALAGRRQAFAPRPLHKGVVPGGVLFGIGWAITGVCPGVALVQIGEGKLAGLWALGGIAAGAALYPLIHQRWLRFDRASCES